MDETLYTKDGALYRSSHGVRSRLSAYSGQPGLLCKGDFDDSGLEALLEEFGPDRAHRGLRNDTLVHSPGKAACRADVALK